MSDEAFTHCLFCDGDPREPDHWRHCDGRQGHVEAAEPEAPSVEALATAPVDPWHNVRTDDPETSYLAAFSHLRFRDSQRWRIYQTIDETQAAGVMDWEVSACTGIILSSANKRRGELRDKGLVMDSGRRGLTPSGSAAIVWVAARWAEHEQAPDFRPEAPAAGDALHGH